MAAAKKKRGAENYLTDQNWENEEEEGEKPGVFKIASEEDLNKRQFKKAKRRGAAGGADCDTEKKAAPFGAFGGFTGFGSVAAVPAPASGLTFGKPASSNGEPIILTFGAAASNGSEAAPAPKLIFGGSEPATNGDAKKLTFGATSSDSEKESTGFSFKPSTAKSESDTPAEKVTSFWSTAPADAKDNFFANRDKAITPATSLFGGAGETKDVTTTSLFGGAAPAPSLFGGITKKEDKGDEEKENMKSTEAKLISEAKSEKTESDDQSYMDRLASLNVSVLNWIKQHVAKNPCIDLTPVFNDYQKHLKDLDCTKKTQAKPNPEVSEPTTATTVFKTPENQATPAPALGQKKPVSVFASTPISSDAGALPSTAISAPKFSSTMFSPGMFSNLNNQKATATVEPAKPAAPVTEAVQEGEPSDAIPDVERKTIEEKDAFHQIRCKLFYKKDAQYKELGVGMLYLKKQPESDKTQLLVRMETAIGKVLLNINLGSGLPKARVGKNNISLVSVPNPPVFSKDADGDNSLPLSYLLRVKGAVEADELMEKIKEADDK